MATGQLFSISKPLTMCVWYVIFGVLTFAGPPLPADALPDQRESYIPVPAQLGGDATFNIDGALASQCKTHDGRLVVECLDGTTMVGIGLEFQNRISGSCDQIKLKDVREEDFNRRFVCENLDAGKYAPYNYKIKATTAPPQNVSLSVNESNLRNKATVAETSTMLEGLLKSVDGDASGSSQNDLQPFDKTKLFWLLVVPLVVLLVLFLVLLRKTHEWCVSRPELKAKQTENGLPLVPCAHHPVPSSA